MARDLQVADLSEDLDNPASLRLDQSGVVGSVRAPGVVMTLGRKARQISMSDSAEFGSVHQNAVSSASSTVIPIFETKSARDLARQALR